MPEAQAISERLRDAYIALGSAIADLRSLPIRDSAGVEEDLHATSATAFITKAEANLASACDDLGVPRIVTSLQIDAAGGLRLVARPVVLEWIAAIHRARRSVAELLRGQGAEVPDDLAGETPLEAAAGTRTWRVLTLTLFAMALVGFFVILGIMICGEAT